MYSEFGRNIKVGVQGGSHEEYVSATANGIPRGITFDKDKLNAFIKRRQGGNLPFTTPRKEDDEPVFVSGLDEHGVTNGEPLEVRIYNKNVRSGDYKGFTDTPRPSHADYTAPLRFGDNIDMRGGGHFSARLTAPLCVIGGILKQALEEKGVKIGTHLYSVGSTYDEPFSLTDVTADDFDKVLSSDFPTLSEEKAEEMKKELEAVAKDADSLGGVVECTVIGFDAGYGDPLYYGVENVISSAMFGLGGVRGIEFGLGFAASKMRGSEHNDPFTVKDGRVVTKTNNSGGVQGGITNGMPIVFRVAFKPTASIGMRQNTVSLSEMTDTEIAIKGRHDPCIAIRALPCVEALTAIVVAEMIISKDGTL